MRIGWWCMGLGQVFPKQNSVATLSRSFSNCQVVWKLDILDLEKWDLTTAKRATTEDTTATEFQK